MQKLTDNELAVLDEIEKAFKNVKHYGKYIGVSYELPTFVGKTREQITWEDYIGSGGLHYFSEKAIQYFLPVILGFTFTHRGAFHYELQLGLLDYLANPDKYICKSDVLLKNTNGKRPLKTYFSEAQIQAVISFLFQFPETYRVQYDLSKVYSEKERRRLMDAQVRDQQKLDESVDKALAYWTSPADET
jgi:hypothetical protein